MAKKFGNNSNSIKMIREAVKKDDTITNDGRKMTLSLDLIDPNPDNAKIFSMNNIEKLAESIKENGFIESKAIGVYIKPNGRYEIYNGERRYRAMRLLGRKEIPAIVSPMPDDVTKAKRLLDSNDNERVKTVMDRARSYIYYKQSILEKSDDWKNVYEGVGANQDKMMEYHFECSSSLIRRYMNLVKLIPQFQEWADKETIPFKVAYSITVKYDEEMQYALYEKCDEWLKEQKEIEIEEDQDGEVPKVVISESRFNNIASIVEREYQRKQMMESLVESLVETPDVSMENNQNISDSETKAPGNEYDHLSIPEKIQYDKEDPKTEMIEKIDFTPKQNVAAPEFEDYSGESAAAFVGTVKTEAELDAVENMEESFDTEEMIDIPLASNDAPVSNMSAYIPEEEEPEYEIDDDLKNALQNVIDITKNNFTIRDKQGIRKMLTELNKRIAYVKTKLLD